MINALSRQISNYIISPSNLIKASEYKAKKSDRDFEIKVDDPVDESLHLSDVESMCSHVSEEPKCPGSLSNRKFIP